jgi:hypothetical protein
LFSADGGSQLFGGPQDREDSSIRFFGELFPLPDAGSRAVPEHIIYFEAKVFNCFEINCSLPPPSPYISLVVCHYERQLIA